MKTAEEYLGLYRDAVLNSYSMVFFSLNRWFALAVLGLSFLDPVAGFAGLFSVVLANGLAILLSFNERMIRNGDLGFNALLVGLGLGAFYELNLPLLILLFFTAFITLFLSIILLGVMSRYALPFLSLPFVFGLWTVMLASRNFEALGGSQRGIYLLNELFAVGDNYLVNIYHYLNEIAIPQPVRTYFRSLGAILFQYNMLTGIVLSLALLLYSRIAFSLSLLGFFTAFGFYELVGADLNELNYSYIGFNYILSAIAIGGIFLVASGWSYLWALLLIPILSILTGSLANLLAVFQLPAYALPFNLAVLGFLYILKWRTRPTGPEVVAYQAFQPEKNRYNQLSSQYRFRHLRSIPASLPVMGEWYISQGHDGDLTHREGWRHAWDLVIVDKEGKPYRGNGLSREDYYCYGKPVVAPADGTVIEILDEVKDNEVGESNLEQNWGNSILIDHGHSLYSQLSHLQPGSFQVKKGDWVHRGQRVAACGASGRSPEPHLHFQLQASPYIGSRTLSYPIAFYLSRTEKAHTRFHFFDFPGEGQQVQNLHPADALKYAFYFAPGKRLAFEVNGKEKVAWECRTDMYNNAYIECLESGARAYYQNNGYVHYFTGFTGSRKSLLYHFFLAHYMVVLGMKEQLEVHDRLPLYLLSRSPLRWVQDLLAPFFQFMEADYSMHYETGSLSPFVEELTLRPEVSLRLFGRRRRLYRFTTHINHYRLERFEVETENGRIIAKWVEDENA